MPDTSRFASSLLPPLEHSAAVDFGLDHAPRAFALGAACPS
jgi:hypothetical protein